MATRAMEHPKVVSPAEWLAARKELLKKEKKFSRLRDQLSKQRRELPWEKVEKQYVFGGSKGKETLADLFGGRSQLIVYHFMLGPGWTEGCPSCSFISDHIDGKLGESSRLEAHNPPLRSASSKSRNSCWKRLRSGVRAIRFSFTSGLQRSTVGAAGLIGNYRSCLRPRAL